MVSTAQNNGGKFRNRGKRRPVQKKVGMEIKVTTPRSTREPIEKKKKNEQRQPRRGRMARKALLGKGWKPGKNPGGKKCNGDQGGGTRRA